MIKWQSNPTDGYAYNKHELNAIWQLQVDVADIIKSFEKKFEFFKHCSQLTSNPQKAQDFETSELIARALIAEVENRQPPKD